MYDKFVKLLQKHEVTSYKVSKETGVSQATLSDWKKGKTTPKIDKLQKIAAYFDVPVSYFMDDEPISSYKMPDNKEAAILKGSRRDFFDILNGLSETELTELENYVRFLLWKHTHSDL